MYFIFLIFLLFSFAYSMTFDEIKEKSLNSNFLKSKEFEVKSFEGSIIKASSFENPKGYIEFGRVFGNNSGFSITQLSISQPLKLYHQMSYEKNMFLKDLDYYYLNFESLKNSYLSEIYTLFYESLYLRSLYNLVIEENDLNKKTYEFVKKMYQLGEVSKLDFLRAEREYNLSIVKLNLSKNNYLESLKKLSSLTGLSVDDVEGNIESLPTIRDIDISNNPKIKAIEKKIESLNYAYQYQKALSKPQITFGLVANEISNRKYSYGFTIDFSIPVFYRNLGEIVSIQNEKVSFKNLKDYEIENLKYKYESIKESYQILKNQLDEIDKNVLTPMKNQFLLSEKAYKLKEINLFEFFTVKNQYYETLKYRLDILNQIHKVYGSYIELGGMLWDS